MAYAAGVASLVSRVAARDYRFVLPSLGNAVVELNGSWKMSSVVGEEKIEWDGANPSIEATQSGTVTHLRVEEKFGSGSGLLIANINHTNVSVNTGDTIVYTSIEITFTTPDI